MTIGLNRGSLLRQYILAKTADASCPGAHGPAAISGASSARRGYCIKALKILRRSASH